MAVDGWEEKRGKYHLWLFQLKLFLGAGQRGKADGFREAGIEEWIGGWKGHFGRRRGPENGNRFVE